MTELYFETVDAYIDFMGLHENCGGGPFVSSYVTPPGAAAQPNFTPMPAPPRIQLSRADAQLLRGITGKNKKHARPAWTEKQREAALLLLSKYRKQLKDKFNVDVSDIITNPIWRDPVRELPTYKGISIEHDKFIISSPFIAPMVELFRTFRHFEGSYPVEVKWDPDKRVWLIEASVRGMRLLNEVTEKYGPFEISDDIRVLQIAYRNALDKPTPPTIYAEHDYIKAKNLTPYQQTVVDAIVNSKISTAMKIWMLADCEFVIDNSVRHLLSKYTLPQYNIISKSVVEINAADMQLEEIIDLFDALKVGSICIAYSWQGDIIDKKIEELRVKYGTRLTIPYGKEQYVSNRFKKYKDPEPVTMPPPLDPSGDQIVIMKQVGTNGLLKRQPVLITFTGLITTTQDADLEATGFTKVIKYQPTL